MPIKRLWANRKTIFSQPVTPRKNAEKFRPIGLGTAGATLALATANAGDLQPIRTNKAGG